MWIILFPSNLGMETDCPFAAAVLRAQNVRQPSQCETKPLQTFSCESKCCFCPGRHFAWASVVVSLSQCNTSVTGEFPEQCKEIAKGRLTLNNTGWAWMYPEKTALRQPHSKTTSFTLPRLSENRNSTAISYPDLLKQRNTLQLCWKLLVPAENRGICHPNNRAEDS